MRSPEVTKSRSRVHEVASRRGGPCGRPLPLALDVCSRCEYVCSHRENNLASAIGPHNGALRQHPPSGSGLVARSP